MERDYGYKMTLNTPNGATGRINHFHVSKWLEKNNLKIKYCRKSNGWDVTSKVSKKQWDEFFKNYKK
jgi:hypothetical protein